MTSVAQPRLQRRPRMSKLARREALDGYLFVLPWILGFLLWVAGPMLASLALAFMRWELFTPPRWVGLDNWRHMLTNPLVRVSLGNTAYYTFLAVPLLVTTSLCLALLCIQEMKARAVFRTLFYLPSVTPAVASAIVWFWILNPEIGLANQALRAIGLQGSQWLWDPRTSKPTFIMMGLWGAGGNTMIIFIAGLQNIPVSLYEAAQIDGANWWSRFRHVTVPMLSPVILFTLVMGVIGSFQIFTGAFLMTGGGPANSTLFTVLYLYRLAFEQFRMGYASGLAWVLFAIILFFTLVQLRLSEAWVYYEGG